MPPRRKAPPGTAPPLAVPPRELVQEVTIEQECATLLSNYQSAKPGSRRDKARRQLFDFCDAALGPLPLRYKARVLQHEACVLLHSAPGSGGGGGASSSNGGGESADLDPAIAKQACQVLDDAGVAARAASAACPQSVSSACLVMGLMLQQARLRLQLAAGSPEDEQFDVLRSATRELASGLKAGQVLQPAAERPRYDEPAVVVQTGEHEATVDPCLWAVSFRKAQSIAAGATGRGNGGDPASGRCTRARHTALTVLQSLLAATALQWSENVPTPAVARQLLDWLRCQRPPWLASHIHCALLDPTATPQPHPSPSCEEHGAAGRRGQAGGAKAQCGQQPLPESSAAASSTTTTLNDVFRDLHPARCARFLDLAPLDAAAMGERPPPVADTAPAEPTLRPGVKGPGNARRKSGSGAGAGQQAGGGDPSLEQRYEAAKAYWQTLREEQRDGVLAVPLRSALEAAVGLLAPKLGEHAAWRALGGVLRAMLTSDGTHGAPLRCAECVDASDQDYAFSGFGEFAQHVVADHERDTGLLDVEQCFRCAKQISGPHRRHKVTGQLSCEECWGLMKGSLASDAGTAEVAYWDVYWAPAKRVSRPPAGALQQYAMRASSSGPDLWQEADFSEVTVQGAMWGDPHAAPAGGAAGGIAAGGEGAAADSLSACGSSQGSSWDEELCISVGLDELVLDHKGAPAGVGCGGNARPLWKCRLDELTGELVEITSDGTGSSTDDDDEDDDSDEDEEDGTDEEEDSSTCSSEFPDPLQSIAPPLVQLVASERRASPDVDVDALVEYVEQGHVVAPPAASSSEGVKAAAATPGMLPGGEDIMDGLVLEVSNAWVAALSEADQRSGSPPGCHVLRWLYGLAGHGPTLEARDRLRRFAEASPLGQAAGVGSAAPAALAATGVGAGGVVGSDASAPASLVAVGPAELRRELQQQVLESLAHLSELVHTWGEASHRLETCIRAYDHIDMDMRGIVLALREAAQACALGVDLGLEQYMSDDGQFCAVDDAGMVAAARSWVDSAGRAASEQLSPDSVLALLQGTAKLAELACHKQWRSSVAMDLLWQIWQQAATLWDWQAERLSGRVKRLHAEGQALRLRYEALATSKSAKAEEERRRVDTRYKEAEQEATAATQDCAALRSKAQAVWRESTRQAQMYKQASDVKAARLHRTADELRRTRKLLERCIKGGNAAEGSGAGGQQQQQEPPPNAMALLQARTAYILESIEYRFEEDPQNFEQAIVWRQRLLRAHRQHAQLQRRLRNASLLLALDTAPLDALHTGVAHLVRRHVDKRAEELQRDSAARAFEALMREEEEREQQLLAASKKKGKKKKGGANKAAGPSAAAPAAAAAAKHDVGASSSPRQRAPASQPAASGASRQASQASGGFDEDRLAAEMERMAREEAALRQTATASRSSHGSPVVDSSSANGVGTASHHQANAGSKPSKQQQQRSPVPQPQPTAAAPTAPPADAADDEEDEAYLRQLELAMKASLEEQQGGKGSGGAVGGLLANGRGPNGGTPAEVAGDGWTAVAAGKPSGAAKGEDAWQEPTGRKGRRSASAGAAAAAEASAKPATVAAAPAAAAVQVTAVLKQPKQQEQGQESDMAVISFYGDWRCGVCGTANQFAAGKCGKCGKSGPCKDYVRGKCKWSNSSGGCRYVHPYFDLATSKPPPGVRLEPVFLVLPPDARLWKDKLAAKAKAKQAAAVAAAQQRAAAAAAAPPPAAVAPAAVPVAAQPRPKPGSAWSQLGPVPSPALPLAAAAAAAAAAMPPARTAPARAAAWDAAQPAPAAAAAALADAPQQGQQQQQQQQQPPRPAWEAPRAQQPSTTSQQQQPRPPPPPPQPQRPAAFASPQPPGTPHHPPAAAAPREWPSLDLGSSSGSLTTAAIGSSSTSTSVGASWQPWGDISQQQQPLVPPPPPPPVMAPPLGGFGSAFAGGFAGGFGGVVGSGFSGIGNSAEDEFSDLPGLGPLLPTDLLGPADPLGIDMLLRGVADIGGGLPASAIGSAPSGPGLGSFGTAGSLGGGGGAHAFPPAGGMHQDGGNAGGGGGGPDDEDDLLGTLLSGSGGETTTAAAHARSLSYGGPMAGPAPPHLPPSSASLFGGGGAAAAAFNPPVASVSSASSFAGMGSSAFPGLLPMELGGLGQQQQHGQQRQQGQQQQLIGLLPGVAHHLRPAQPPPPAAVAAVAGLEAGGLLGALLQGLWHLPAVRSTVLDLRFSALPPMGCSPEEKVLRAVYSTFLRLSDAAALAPTSSSTAAAADPSALRTALASVDRPCFRRHDWPWACVPDATEAILECLDRAGPAAGATPRGFVHHHHQSHQHLSSGGGAGPQQQQQQQVSGGVFRLPLREATMCGTCGRHTAGRQYGRYLQAVPASALRALRPPAPGGSSAREFELLLRCLSAGQQDRRVCDTAAGGCGSLQPLRVELLRAPRALTLAICWDLPPHSSAGSRVAAASSHDISAVCGRVALDFDLRNGYQCVCESVSIPDFYRLRCMVVRTTKQVGYNPHGAFVYVPRERTWRLYGAAAVQGAVPGAAQGASEDVGGWAGVSQRCASHGLQPLLLMYESKWE